MDNTVYTIWLENCLGIVCRKSKDIINSFESSRHIYESSEIELRQAGIFSNNEISRLMNKNSLELAQRIYNRAQETGNRIISVLSNDYPKRLMDLDYPPFLIYVKGEIPKTNGLKVAVVGSREASMVGRQTAFDFAYNLSKFGALVISGGAEGIDSQAHRGALQAGARTICVLGCGSENSYNKKNLPLRREITLHGAVISEYPPDAAPAERSFPERNRIIAALSDCCLVVEAGFGSGSLITASKAAKLGRKIFAVPGSLDNPHSEGSNMLLTAGAIGAVTHKDIFKWFYPERKTSESGKMNADEVDKMKRMKSRDTAMDSLFIPEGIDNENHMPEKNVKKRRNNSHYSDAPAAENIKQTAGKSVIEKSAGRAIEKPVKKSVKSPVKEPDEQPINETTEIPRGKIAEKPVINAEEDSEDKTRRPKMSTSQKQKNRSIEELFNEEVAGSEKKISGNDKKIKNNLAEMLTKNALSVYDTISGTPIDADTISNILGMEINVVLSALTELEIYGFAERSGVSKYIKNQQ